MAQLLKRIQTINWVVIWAQFPIQDTLYWARS